MKKLTFLFSTITLIIFVAGCEKNDGDFIRGKSDGFNLVINNSVVYNSSQIQYYDFSSQLIYLREGNSFTYSDFGSFSVFVDDEEIYTGQLFPGYSSYLPSGPVIHLAPTFYKDYIIPIGFNQFNDKDGNPTVEDPRSDSKIIDALKKYNQYKKGMSSDILSIEKLAPNKIKISIQLTNLDSDNLLILDPDKMGIELFHYFTNGLALRDSLHNTFTHNLTIEELDPWYAWDKDWLTEIRSNETKIISITYNDFENIEPGEYTAWFSYPGLSFQISREDLEQGNARIWLGELNNKMMIEFE